MDSQDKPSQENPTTGESLIPQDLPRPSGWKVLMVFVLFLLLLVALFLVGYVPHEKQVKETRADAADRANQVPRVAVARPKEQASTKNVILPCDLRPNLETAIYSRANGYVSKLYVDIDDRVEAGQLLAEIDTPEVDAQLVQSKAALEQAKANLAKARSDAELARRTLERYRELPAGVATEVDLDTKQAAWDAARASVEQAQATIGVAQADVQRLTVLQGFEKVVAPFSGIITARNYDVGALVTPGTTNSVKEIFRLVQSTTLRAFIYVPQVYALEIRPGQEATLSVRNYADRQFPGTVARLAGELAASSRTMLFEVRFDNPKGELYAGMYGQVHLTLSSEKSALVIPTAALIFDAAGTQVAIVHNDHVHLQNVTLGRDLGTELEVLSGLSTTDDVISNPAGQLGEGALVQVVPGPKAVAQAK